MKRLFKLTKQVYIVLMLVVLLIPHQAVALEAVDVANNEQSSEQPAAVDLIPAQAGVEQASSADSTIAASDVAGQVVDQSHVAEKPIQEPVAENLEQVDQASTAETKDNLAVANQSQTESLPTDPVAQHQGIVVSQVQTSGGTGKTAEELIEIYNNSDSDVDVTKWSILSDTSAPVIYTFSPAVNEPGNYVVLPARSYFVIATPAFVSAHVNEGFSPDDSFANSKISNSNGSIRIIDASANFVSGVAWGSGTIADGNPMAALSSAGGVIERIAIDTLVYQDTLDNKSDFKTGQLRQSYQIGSIRDVYDACLNIEGVSELVPEGWLRDKKTGNCTESIVEVKNNCEGIAISEIGANLAKQYIELHNPTNRDIDLKGCILMTNRSTKQYIFPSETTLTTQAYLSVYIETTDLTLTKTTSGTVYFLSEDGLREVDSVSYKDLDPDTSWSKINDKWQQTFSLTPGDQNQMLAYLPCDNGYIRNELTGRCNKQAVAALPTPCKDGQYRSEETGRCRAIALAGSTLTPCKEGQYRSEETNRCRSIATTTSSLKPCNDDQFRNPETGRCKKIASTDDILKPCDAGYERNPETNRCRKVVNSITDAAAIPFPVESINDGAKIFAAWWALGGVLLLGACYAVWEWRQEIRNYLSGFRSRNS